MTYRVRLGRTGEGRRLGNIERRAAHLFRLAGLYDVANQPPAPAAYFDVAAENGLLFVVEAQGEPAGFLLSEILDGLLHLSELNIDPDHMGQRLGARLIDHAAAAARARGFKELSLATFKDVPWNAPYYARLGFTPVMAAALGPDHVALWLEQSERFRIDDRVLMRRPAEDRAWDETKPD